MKDKLKQVVVFLLALLAGLLFLLLTPFYGFRYLIELINNNNGK